MNRGEVWLAHVGAKLRPVVVLTRDEVLDVRRLVTVAEVTTSIRGLAVEVPLDHASVGIVEPSVINCDGLHTVAQSTLVERVGSLDDPTLSRVCLAVTVAIGC